MSSLAKQILKNEIKKIYKENTKNIPKRNRIPFSEFFKQYRKLKAGQHGPVNDEMREHEALPSIPEDFDFNEMVNVNKDLQVEEMAPLAPIEEKIEEEKKE